MGQTSEYKSSIVSRLQIGDLVGVRSESTFGKAIRFLAGGNVNHTAIYIGNGLVLEACYDVGIHHINEYVLNDKSEIYCCRPKGLTEEQKKTLIDSSIPIWASAVGYDVVGLFGLAFRFWIQRYWWRIAKYFNWYGQNRAAQPGKVWCSELAGRMYKTINFSFTNEDVTWLTPNEVYESENVIKLN